ncbi:MAG: D-alanyl-D-alanine carboxypeptidase/D-alanyl-D-alanine-endopeptidase [Candidatus Acidiferrales bacterium]
MNRNVIRIGILAVLISSIVSLPLFAQKSKKKSPSSVTSGVAQFHRDVEAALADPNAQKAFLGVLIVDAQTKQPLYELNADRYFTPASNTKLFTTALALATLGPDYRFRTTMETRGTLDPSGRLRGDLILVGRGDPDFSNRRIPYDAVNPIDGPSDKPLAELVDAIVARGVKEIDGDIVGDDSYFPYEPYPEGWAVGDLPEDYGAAISAICFDDNGLDVKVTPGNQIGAAAWVTVEPWPGYDVYDYGITTGAADSAPDFHMVAEPGPKKFLLRGSIPLGHATMDLPAAMPEPADYTAHVLKQMLLARGIRVTGDARAQHAPPPPENPPTESPSLAPSSDAPAPAPLVLAEHDSPPLIEIVRVLNKVSENQHAEILLRTVAKEQTGMGSLAGGLAIEQKFLTSIGVAPGDVLVDDGSGLSRGNLVTPRAVVALLEYVRQQPWGDAFVTTLPVAGVDGTLEHRLIGTPAEGRIQAKTGSVEHTQAVSGFATTLRGEHLIFSIFDNHNGGPSREAVKVLDLIAVAMVQDLGTPAKKPSKKHK